MEPLSGVYLDEIVLLIGFYFVAWCTLAFIFHMAFSILELGSYTQKVADRKLEYISWWLAIVHSLVVPWMCIYYLFFTCDTGLVL